ncbi:MAG TPA: tetratricopeptide repeat protein [Candidatus Binataceae bacterium]|nr:tetratricopeptide repeat protein [Candidatus Binataceae bacterium]
MPSSSKTQRHHISRKELKQPDEFMVFASEVQDFVARHIQKVALGAAVLAVLAASGFAVYHYQQVRTARAAQLFYAGFHALDGKQYSQAEAIFSQLAAQRSHSEIGRLANLYLGLTYLKAGKLAQARDKLVNYADQGTISSFRQLALLNLGVVYEQMGNLSGAQQAYSAAANLSGPAAVDARLAQARVLAAQGKRQAAIGAYDAFLASSPEPSQRQQAVAGLAQLGAQAPAPFPPQPFPSAP